MKWPTVALGDCGDIQGGLQVSSKRAGLPLSRPYLRVANVQRGQLDLAELKMIDATPAEVDRTLLKVGDLLFVEGHANPREVGRVAVWDGSVPQCVHQNHLIRLRPNTDTLLPEFAVRWFNTPAGAAHFRRSGKTTSGLNTISASTVRNAPTLLPPIEEQRRIAAIIDQAHSLRQKCSAIVDSYQELTRSLYLDMFGSPVSNATRWPVRRVDQLGVVTTGRTPPAASSDSFGGPVPFVTPGDLESAGNVARSLTRLGADRSRTVRIGATFVCCIGATIGKVGHATQASAFNQQINAIEWGSDIEDGFGFWTMKLLKPLIASLGSSTTMPLLPKSKFGAVMIQVPPLDIQRAFTTSLTKIENQQADARKALELARELVSSIEFKLFNGHL